MSTPASPRKAVRALVMTPQNEFLLIKIANPNGKWVGWITPGGGVDPGESNDVALKRELFEELGLTQFAVKAHIWKRRLAFEWDGQTLDQSEDFYLIEVDRFDVTVTHNHTELEQKYLKEFRWWTIKQLQKSNEVFAPIRLLPLLLDLIQNGPPPTPVDAGA